jgi:hypothetical protein
MTVVWAAWWELAWWLEETGEGDSKSNEGPCYMILGGVCDVSRKKVSIHELMNTCTIEAPNGY